ncbi:MAG: DUF7672 family protein [Minisyncoccales bacterium]
MLPQKLLIIFITGFFILIGAIFFNIIANFIGLVTWYDFIYGLAENGFKEFLKLNFLSVFFLFIFYPFLLGLIGYLSYYLFY